MPCNNFMPYRLQLARNMYTSKLYKQTVDRNLANGPFLVDGAGATGVEEIIGPFHLAIAKPAEVVRSIAVHPGHASAQSGDELIPALLFGGLRLGDAAAKFTPNRLNRIHAL